MFVATRYATKTRSSSNIYKLHSTNGVYFLVKNEYLDKHTNIPVRIDGVFEKELIEKAKRVLALQRKGVKINIS